MWTRPFILDSHWPFIWSAKKQAKPTGRVFFANAMTLWAQCIVNLVCKSLTNLPLKVHKHEIYFGLFLQKPKPYGPKGLWHEIFENRIGFGRDIRLLNISAHAQHAMKSVPSMLSMRWNWFPVCSVCDKICFAYAKHTHAIIFENDSKIPN